MHISERPLMAHSIGTISQKDKTKLLHNGALVSDLYQCIKYGGDSLNHVPGLIIKIVNERSWRHWIDPNTGEEFNFDNFARFITTETGKGGLGTTIPMLEDICRRDNKAAKVLTLALKRPDGPEKRNNQYDITVHNMNSYKRPWGTSKASGLRRLAKEAELNSTAAALQAKVIENEMSVHAALVQLGIRQKTLTITLDPTKIAAKLKKHLTDDQLLILIELLSFSNGDT